ncbi:MAG: ribosome silencing factor [Muribaculaceae bacterium]|nr:ribosome silencing factor [Muribaculaceae bacterium]
MNQQLDIVNLITEGIRERKGRKITLIDLDNIDTAATHNFVICEGTSTMHVSAIADSVREYLLLNAGIKPYNYDGYSNSQWIVLDYGSTMVHVFLPDERQRYNLEELWSDGNMTQLPDLD